MIFAGALAFLLTYAALRDSAETVDLAIAITDMPSGATIDVGRFQAYNFLLGPGGPPPGLVTLSEVKEAAEEGRHLSGALAAGSLLRSGDIATSTTTRPRAMSFSVDESRAVGGSLVVGDLVAIVAADQSGARFVVAGAPIVALSSGGSAAGRAITLTIEVDAATSLRLAHSLSSSGVHLVRSTSSAPADLDLLYPPVLATQEGGDGA